MKKGPYGWYLQAGETVKDKKVKPKRATIPPGISPANVDLNMALKLLNLPMLVGDHPESGEEILLGIGRFGPYLKHKDKFTSIPKNIDPFTIDVSQAVAIIKAGLAKAEAREASNGARNADGDNKIPTKFTKGAFNKKTKK